MAEHDLIDDYLERLRDSVRGTPEQRDDVVAELRDHLLEATERLQEDGIDARDAQILALGRLGEVAEVARSYGLRRRSRPGARVLAAAAAVVALAALGAGALMAAAPFGRDPGLAHRLGIEPKDLQEPSEVEINGVPLPRTVRADDPRFRAIAERMAILDG